MMNFVFKNEEFRIQNEEFRIQNEECCIKNEEFRIKNEELCRLGARRRLCWYENRCGFYTKKR